MQKAVERFDDDAPLRETGDGAESVQQRLHLMRDTNAELRVVFDSFAVSGAGRRPAGTSASFVRSVVGHDSEGLVRRS